MKQPKLAYRLVTGDRFRSAVHSMRKRIHRELKATAGRPDLYEYRMRRIAQLEALQDLCDKARQ